MNGYPENPDPLAPARGFLLGLVLVALMWLAMFVLLLIALRT